jgi:excisionase family DNA binding protein
MDVDKWLTLDELAEYLKLGRTTLYRMAQEGDIPASKVGSQWRFDREEIDDWVRAQRSSRHVAKDADPRRSGSV